MTISMPKHSTLGYLEQTGKRNVPDDGFIQDQAELLAILGAADDACHDGLVHALHVARLPSAHRPHVSGNSGASLPSSMGARYPVRENRLWVH
jgi:hypothetical protein